MTRRALAPKADRERASRAGEHADVLYAQARDLLRVERPFARLEEAEAGTLDRTSTTYHRCSPEWWQRYAEALHAAHDAAEIAADAFEEAHQERRARAQRVRAKRIREMFAIGGPRRDPSDRPKRISDRPRSVEGNENLAYLLDRDVRAIGPERAASLPAKDIRLLISPSGSYRYVGLENGHPVSALQIMSSDGGVRGIIANVYTTPVARRRGWAARLLEVARRRFREVRHSDDLSPAGEAWKSTVRDAARDKDYRGQPVPFDFARAVFETRRQRPGALEVLRDGIEEWFPKQYADAVADAEHHWAETRMPWVVLFNGRVARARFRRWQDARSTVRSPFDIQTAASIARNGTPSYSVIVWPRERVKRTEARGN